MLLAAAAIPASGAVAKTRAPSVIELSSPYPLGTSSSAPAVGSPDRQAQFRITPFSASSPTAPNSILSSLDILTQAASACRMPPCEDLNALPAVSLSGNSAVPDAEPWVSENGVHGSAKFRFVAPAAVDGSKKKRIRRKNKSEPLRCFHCGVTNTLHWRYGPNGKNTLCNACGLKYAKSMKMQQTSPPAEKLKVEWLLN